MDPSEDWGGGTPQGQLLWGCGQGQYYCQKGALNVPSQSMRTASFIFLSQDSLIPKQVLSRGVSSITRKAASGCWSSRAGPYAGQTACVGHPCRAHGICSPSLGSGFQYGAGAKAPQLSKEMKKKPKSERARTLIFSTLLSFLGPLLSGLSFPHSAALLFGGGGVRCSYIDGRKSLDGPEAESSTHL